LIRKAIIPAAGLGTRFLPLTKAQPKEMLPIVDKPVIQYVVEEAILSGITDILIITGKNKRAIEDHFDSCFELEYRLEKNNNIKLLDEIRKLSNMVNIQYVRQKEQKGLGDAILYAEQHCNNKAFAVLLGDTITIPNIGESPCIAQLINTYNKYEQTVIAIKSMSYNEIKNYGIISGEKQSDNIYLINNIIEKPNPENAPSNMGIIGRYIITPDIFNIIKNTHTGFNNEIQLTDALAKLDKSIGVITKCKQYDIGNKLNWIKSNIELSMQRDEFSSELKIFLKTLI